jgi:hypothetical protein
MDVCHSVHLLHRRQHSCRCLPAGCCTVCVEFLGQSPNLDLQHPSCFQLSSTLLCACLRHSGRAAATGNRRLTAVYWLILEVLLRQLPVLIGGKLMQLRRLFFDTSGSGKIERGEFIAGQKFAQKEEVVEEGNMIEGRSTSTTTVSVTI